MALQPLLVSGEMAQQQEVALQSGALSRSFQPLTPGRGGQCDTQARPCAANGSDRTISLKNRQDQLWEDFFSHPAQWWDNRQDKKSPRHPDFRHKVTKEPLWLNNRYNPAWLEVQLATFDAQLGAGSAGSSSLSGAGASLWGLARRYERDKQVETWSKLCEEGELSEAIGALECLVQQGTCVDTCLLYMVLKRCIGHKNLLLGRRVHSLAVRSGNGANTFLANHIIRMYASHAMLEEATQVLTNLDLPNSFVWASIIKAHADHGQATGAINLYRRMQDCSVKPNNYIFVAVLKACATAGDLVTGKQVHDDIIGGAYEPDIFVSNSLVDMYAKCGSLEDARGVFDLMATRDVVTWNTMIAAYAKHGLGQEALKLYASMKEEGLTVANPFTYAGLLKACGSIGDLQCGKHLHLVIQEKGLEVDVVVGSCLVDMYAKCGSLEDARTVFESLPERNVVTWTAMIAGCAQRGFGQEALNLFRTMQQNGMTPADRVTFVCLLKACATVGDLHQGKHLHLLVQRKGLEAEVGVGSCLVDMYAKCGSIEDARRVFDRLPARDVVTWTAMIAGYVQHALGEDALQLYACMQEEGVTPANQVTFVCLLKACTSERALQQGKQLHTLIEERGFEHDLVVCNCLVEMYAKCGNLEDARKVFDTMAIRDVITWNAMIGGYAQHGCGQEVLELYRGMQQESITPPNMVTFMWLLKGCASVGALHQGKLFHFLIRERGLEGDVVVGNCLVDMYAKCGSLEDARQVFDRLSSRDVVTWNAMLNGYAEHSDGHMAIKCFEEMVDEGVKPNEATFSSLLVACSHAWLVNEGRQYFKTMVEEHGIVPTDYHHNCMVDLLGRSGHLEEAEGMLQSVAFTSEVVGWTSLLSACKIHGDLERARRCFERLVSLEPDDASAYVLLGSMYANAGLWTDVEKVEKLRKCAGAWKKPAKACIEVENKVHEFTVGEDRVDIGSTLRSMNLRLKVEGGHVPHKELVLKTNMSDREKEDALCGHAEKLALAYGLVNTPDGTTLVVTKNLRMCNDCHGSTKIMSRLEKREIIVRDAHRVHRFADGSCSCGDRA